MALYVTRPRRDEERIGRGLLSDEERIGRGLPSDNLYHPRQAKTGNVHPGRTLKFRKNYSLCHINCVSQTLQEKRVSTSAPLFRNRLT